MLELGSIPDCESCQEPTKIQNGVIFDLPEPGAKTAIYTCKNRGCRERYNTGAAIMLSQERAKREGWS